MDADKALSLKEYIAKMDAGEGKDRWGGGIELACMSLGLQLATIEIFKVKARRQKKVRAERTTSFQAKCRKAPVIRLAFGESHYTLLSDGHTGFELLKLANSLDAEANALEGGGAAEEWLMAGGQQHQAAALMPSK